MHPIGLARVPAWFVRVVVLLTAMFALLVVVVPAKAQQSDTTPEPPHIAEVRAQFLADMKAGGADPSRCRLDYLESTPEAHFVRLQCEELPNMCVVAVHPTEVLMRPIGCAENPSYDPHPAPKQSL
jgi:hypothetical protein